jgi:hypothetical protein
MANYCAGVTANWDNTAFSEVTDIKVSYGGSLPLGRDSFFSVDVGTIEITCLSTARISVSQYGKKAALAISGGGLDFTAKAVCQTLQIVGKVNDVARYLATFKIVRE